MNVFKITLIILLVFSLIMSSFLYREYTLADDRYISAVKFLGCQHSFAENGKEYKIEFVSEIYDKYEKNSFPFGIIWINEREFKEVESNGPSFAKQINTFSLRSRQVTVNWTLLGWKVSEIKTNVDNITSTVENPSWDEVPPYLKKAFDK